MNREIYDEMYEFDFSVRNYETFEHEVVLEDEDGNLIDLSGKTSAGMVRVNPGAAGSPVATMACTIDRSRGSVTFRLTSAQTATIPPGKYAYDVCLVETVSGETIRKYIIGGVLNVLPSVTH